MGGEGYEDGDHGGDEPGVARTEYEHDAHHDAKRRAGEEASCLSSVYMALSTIMKLPLGRRPAIRFVRSSFTVPPATRRAAMSIHEEPSPESEGSMETARQYPPISSPRDRARAG